MHCVSRRLRFNYPSRPDQPALDDVTLDIAPGETVAVVGPSGAGKSTLLQLMLRFYDPQAGRILLDGIDIARVDPLALRRQIGFVPQDTVLFAASARENIRYGRPDASDAEVEAAARRRRGGRLHPRTAAGLRQLPRRARHRLSGGQRQRIAIARAILKDPPVLLLDEATSSLDAESERLIQQALDGLMGSRTTVIVAHRLGHRAEGRPHRGHGSPDISWRWAPTRRYWEPVHSMRGSRSCSSATQEADTHSG